MSSWTKVRQAIKEKYGTTAARRKKAEAALRTIEQLNGRRALEDRRHLLETRTEDLDRDARRCLSAIAAARFAQMIAALNTSLTAQKASMPPNKHAATSKALTELHRATVAGDWQAAGAQGTALAAAGLHSALQSIHALATDAARKSATSQLQRAEEFRNAFEVMTIGMWANWVSGWPPSLRTLLEWQGAAKALRMSKKRTWPAGTLVKGLVESVKISHVAKKAVSVALVRAGKKVKTVGIAHIKLDSSGIVAGAHIVARCRPAAKVDWYRDSPVYQLKQFQTSEAASKYWYDWLVLRGNGLFMSRPHEFAASWTLQRAGDGAGNPLRYGVWTGPSTFQRKPYGSL